jgi:hypothetical protein
VCGVDAPGHRGCARPEPESSEFSPLQDQIERLQLIIQAILENLGDARTVLNDLASLRTMTRPGASTAASGALGACWSESG